MGAWHVTLSDLDSLLGGIQGEEDGQLEASASESDSEEEGHHGPPTVDLTQLRPSPERPRRFMDHFHRLTDAEIREMAEQARAIQALPVDEQDENALQQNPPPAVASGPPDQEEDQDDGQDEDQQDEEEESPLSFISNRQASPATPEHQIDLEERPQVSPEIARDHRVRSILTTGARTFVPPEARGQFFPTPDTAVTRNIVAALTRHGHLRPGRAKSAYRLFALAKDETRARVLYDLSPLTRHLEPPPCFLPRAIDLLQSTDPLWAIKVGLRHGFYHIPIHPGLQPYMGVRLDNGEEYLWTVLPMGLATAPALMQAVMTSVVKYVQDRIPGVTGKVYLDDFLFHSTRPADLLPIPALLRDIGLQMNTNKSVLEPTQQLTYLGLQLDLANRRISIPRTLQRKILKALVQLPDLSHHQAERLAGYINFVRPVARLPLQVVIATLQQDPRIPLWVQQGVWDHDWSFDAEDYHNWFRAHQQAVAVDATPYQLGFADASAAIAVPLERPIPIYRAELLAALLAALQVPPGTTVFSDNQAVIHNLHKGRCPPSWLPWISALFAHRGNSFRYVPSAANPADAPSRWGRPREAAP
ncbi:Protein P [Amphibalanus amphitrite]|uniref:Protein P n=1 Tax=Amphibalanus amphitrite TaxID=1232801 RepID=A0A6A4W1U0_AMPAM|nr:Protein P [Amphibalanus amphitrite]